VLPDEPHDERPEEAEQTRAEHDRDERGQVGQHRDRPVVTPGLPVVGPLAGVGRVTRGGRWVGAALVRGLPRVRGRPRDRRLLGPDAVVGRRVRCVRGRPLVRAALVAGRRPAGGRGLVGGPLGRGRPRQAGTVLAGGRRLVGPAPVRPDGVVLGLGGSGGHRWLLHGDARAPPGYAPRGPGRLGTMSEDAAGPQTAQDAVVEASWATARRRAGLDRLDVVVGQQPLGTVPPPAWSFGSDPTTAAARLALLLEGRKTATASPAQLYG